MSILVIVLLVALIVTIYKSERTAILECIEIIVHSVKHNKPKLINELRLIGYEYSEAFKSLVSPLKGTCYAIGALVALPIVFIRLFLFIILGATYSALVK